MTKRREQKPGYGKILDAWTPPEDAGEPVGCVATSFTFSPALFEEECLSRFLQLDSDAIEDGAAYLVEREEKLSQLVCAAALVDQHHARGVRSLRWDFLPARLPSRCILHAKVALLLWSRYARVIVASANLTEDGYRRNHEVFGVLDYFADSEMPLTVLDDILDFLREAAEYAVAPDRRASPAVDRWRAFLERARTDARRWGMNEAPRLHAKPRVFPVITGPARENAFSRLRTLWPSKNPPNFAAVISPFFDPVGAVNPPARELWRLLRQRGDATLEFNLTTEEVPGERALMLHAPESLLTSQPAGRAGTRTIIRRLRLEEGRPLHAKKLWLENDSFLLLMMGSSNFTSAGLGLGETKNLEANLAYAVSLQNEDDVRALENAWLPVEDVPDNIELRWQPLIDDDQDSADDSLRGLPIEFDEATFGSDEAQRGFIQLTFIGAPPAGWMLHVEDEREVFLKEDDWVVKGAPPQLRIAWDRERPPSGFCVKWGDATCFAWWPVNVCDGAALPPPAELKDLPLDVLIEVLTSARPLHQALQRWLRRRQESKQDGTVVALDSHKRVDTSGFLLQRTRRVSDALRALRQRLERPAVSKQALAWRLRGPVGALALAQAIGREARSEEERCFLLTELCLELNRIQPRTAPGSLSAEQVRTALAELAKEIRRTISPETLNGLPALAGYVRKALGEDLP